MLRPKVSKNREAEDVEAEASSHREVTFNTQSNNQSEIMGMPALITMQQNQ